MNARTFLPPRIARLADRLAHPLPARRAHSKLWPEEPPLRPLDAFPPDYRQAAVLLLLFPRGDGYAVPLIRRPAGMESHAGQVALPGGERDPGEAVVACALREAREEVGIDPDALTVLGGLSPIPIPVSRYRVDPVVAYAAEPPRFALAPREVVRLLLADPDLLLARGPTAQVERIRDGQHLSIPAYQVEGEAVWGATGFILAEFLDLWEESGSAA